MSETDGRKRRAGRSRERIIDAAAHLFVERGYVTATIEDIAAHAGVAVQTVYYVFGTKRNVLAAVLDTHIAGDHELVPVAEQAWVDDVAAATDPAAAIETLVAAAVGIIARAAPAYEVVRRAAADPEIGELLAQNRASRRADQRRLVEALWRGGQLRPDLDLDSAADVFYGLLNEEIYALLVVDCGWDLDRFRAWATDVIQHHVS